MRRWLISLAVALTIVPGAGLAQTLLLPSQVIEGQPVRLSAFGLPGGTRAVLVVRRITSDGAAAESRSTYEVADDGTLDPERDVALEGDYQGLDPAGPFWSMRPVERTAEEPGRLAVKVLVDGASVVEAEAEWLAMPSDIVTEDIAAFVGARLYRSTAGHKLPAIIVLGGSEGGSSASRASAARLAGFGYAALAVPYYNPGWSGEHLPGLPDAFADIPVDRLDAIHDWILSRPDLDPHQIGLYGVSKGGEFALIAASRFAWLRAVAAIVPSDVVWEGWGTDEPDGSRSSFAWQGQALPFVPYVGMTEAISAISQGQPRSLVGAHLEGRRASPARAAEARIPVERYCGALLVAGGDQDMTWPSGSMVRAIAERRGEVGLPTVALTFADAGHSLSNTGWAPINLPGNVPSPAISAAAQRQVWEATRSFFAQYLAAEKQIAGGFCDPAADNRSPE